MRLELLGVAMNEWIELMSVKLGAIHTPTGNTKHWLVDSAGKRPFPHFVSLTIAQYPGDTGFYLLYKCDDGQGTDTWHQSLEDAQHQAEFEFGVRLDEWINHI